MAFSRVILSPHFDDAVFSCWHLLTQPGTIVITVFAGTPSAGTTTLWDKICGESDSVTMMSKRIRENETVLKENGILYLNLPYLDKQYPSSSRDIPGIANAVLSQAGQVNSDTVFFAPLAGSKLWRHPDHVTIREVGKFLLSKGKNVSFYADIPYMRIPAHTRAGYKRRMSQRASKLIGTGFLTEVSGLNASDQRLKQKAMRQYGSQYKTINLASLGMLGRKANTQREIVFYAA